MQIAKLSDIIPDIENGMTYKKIALKYGRSEPTIWRWVGKLRKGGFNFKTKRGRKTLLL